MDPEAIKKRIVEKAQKERAQQIKESNEIEENKQRLKNIEIKAFVEANAVLSQIVNDLRIKKDVKITKTDAALTIYWPNFGGGSDTYKYFYNSSVKKLCLRHCLSPVELCQYILAKGVRKHGSEALF